MSCSVLVSGVCVREELQCVQERLGTEEMTREEIYKELQVVREDYQKEMIAIEHSRKISKYVHHYTAREAGVGSWIGFK